MFDKRTVPSICLGISLAVFAAGCHKGKTPIAQAPPPSPAAAPVATPAPAPAPAAPVVAQFTAEPTSIIIGQSSTLRWQVTGDASSVTIDQTIGTVQNTGSRRVFPSQSTTYTLTAAGAAGSTTASATVTVTEAPAPPPPTTPSVTRPAGYVTLEKGIESKVLDAYFDYDQSEIRGDSQSVLTQDAAAIKALLADFPNAIFMVEGHCDERGSAEYNLGLGDRRAGSAKEFLVQLGVPADRLHTISYGKERPQCTESDEACWQKNRRVHFAPGQ